MSSERQKIDELIKETLSADDAKFYDALDEQNLLGKVGETFKGKMGWLAIVMNIANIIFFILFIYAVIQFFNATGTAELIKWAMAIFGSFMFMAFIKLYVWMQMNKNDILRELKRLELQVAVLSNERKQ
ncbi:hypothetical protein FGM00_10655 [Aggregatimonas sangjinii]|uniref:Uncharacterized protein n=1 Tax=Aggregatimonas sangjinii TaxID=2583587 RepID=A0A5B7SUQ4_9FLAO|nr:DUF6768 family protein [Aggregatimonas sangjinii]QCX00550.1 hypothetical protein FGM00_10655 [Aggregatimonas sangjinii]